MWRYQVSVLLVRSISYMPKLLASSLLAECSCIQQLLLINLYHGSTCRCCACRLVESKLSSAMFDLPKPWLTSSWPWHALFYMLYRGQRCHTAISFSQRRATISQSKVAYKVIPLRLHSILIGPETWPVSVSCLIVALSRLVHACTTTSMFRV